MVSDAALWATGNGHEEVVKLLLEKGAKLESRDNEWGQTPLSWAARCGPRQWEASARKGAELESKDNKWGLTTLSWL